MQIVDKLCDALSTKDKQQRSQLSQAEIHDAFKSLKITLNSAQMAKILGPLNPDPLDGSYNYVQMIELLFGRSKQEEVIAKYKLGVSQTNR
jgi:hypothetical protein